ncbi:MAG TPA: hypothetical protein VK590_12695 [Saprospiraceae bacterium]|nr:hypothetical protein [Saprospiraceae bacterium]
MGSKTNQKGILETRFDFKNNLNYINLFHTATNQSNSQHIYVLASYTLIKITYKDYEKIDQTKYFCIEGSGAYEITYDDYEKRKVNRFNSQLIEYSSLNFEQMLTFLKEQKTI